MSQLKSKNTEKKLIVLSAPSGAGKTTLCQKLLAAMSAELVLSISSTTRAPRGSEQNGQEYFFLPVAEFEKQIAAGDFAEWALVHGNYYGTSKTTIENAWKKGKHVLLDIDVQGAASLREAFPDQTICIFISPPDLETLEKRLRARGTEAGEAISKRMRNAREEMARAKEFDHILINQDLTEAEKKLINLVKGLL